MARGGLFLACVTEANSWGIIKIVDFSTWPESVKADNWLEMQAPRSSWRQMGASWCQMGASWRQMGASRRKICASWRQMGFGGH